MSVSLRNVLRFLAPLSIALCSCSSEDDTGDTPGAETVEVFSLWANGGERDALDKLIEVHQARRPNASVIETVEGDFTKYNDRLDQRMASGNPPSTFQSNQGMRLKKWVVLNNVDDSQSKLTAIDDLAGREGWRNVFPTEIIDVNSFRGHLYGVPLSIIRQNTLYYNVRVLRDNGIDPAELVSVDSLLLACQKLSANGVTPLAIGNKNKWVLDMFLWENLFPAVAGPDYYLEFWKGQRDPTDSQVGSTLEKMVELWQYFNTDQADYDWPDGMQKLFPTDGSAPVAMAQMGDWATGFYKAQGLTPGEDFGAIPFPGTGGVFVFSADVFPLVTGTEQGQAAEEFIVTVGDRVAQEEFNKIKGSLPARIDASLEGFTDLQMQSFADFNAGIRIPVVHGLKPDDIMALAADTELEMVEFADPQPMLNYLKANYVTLQQVPR